MTAPLLGVTVMPEYIQSEGISPVLDRLQGLARAGSVTTSPYVAAEAAPGQGEREPPGDAGKGSGRLLDRPLWGKREVWMETASSFRPDPTLYRDLEYRPPEANALTDASGSLVGAFLDEAVARGMETWLQVQAAIPPGHRVQFGGPLPGDEPLLPNGTPGGPRVDRNVSLGSRRLRDYMRAFISDICRNYPQADGIKFDWPEYPVYTFESLFFDFNPSIAPIGRAVGTDLATLARGTSEVLHDLGSAAIRQKRIALDNLDTFLASLIDSYPVLAELLALKAAVVEDYARFLRETLDAASDGRKRMFLQSFPPPLNRATGLDFARAGAVADVVGVKLYTMHWPLIEAGYIAALQSRADIAPDSAARVISRLLALSPDVERRAGAIRYPEPDEVHPAASADLAAKIVDARNELPATVELVAISHGYGPVADVARRARAVIDARPDAVHVNRYCYLSDEKLRAIGNELDVVGEGA
ncbi:MAG: hypothetical protein LJE62_11800 [Silicimonas sp.]|nr:hypothetical protein [Silicimonas sp.]